MIPIPAPPMPAGDDTASVLKALLDGQSALLQGVNDIRANAVTRQQLQAFHDLQATEMRTYVQAELAPVHNTLRQYSADVGSVNDRVGRLELHSGTGAARPEPHDPARRRVAFIGFGAQTAVDERVSAMDNFIKSHFPNIRPSCVNLFPDKTGQPSLHGFVEFGSPQQARMITEGVRSRKLVLDGHAAVKIKPALTDIDKTRNWALSKAREIVQASPLNSEKSVTVQKGDRSGSVRGVYVNDIAAFTQADRFAKGWSFVGSYSHLKLP